MARQLRITEEQARMLRAEGITLNADVAATNGNVDQAVRNTRQQAKDSGVDLKDVTIQVPGSDTNESKSNIIPVKKLRENRLNALRQHAQKFTVKDFMASL